MTNQMHNRLRLNEIRAKHLTPLFILVTCLYALAYMSVSWSKAIWKIMEIPNMSMIIQVIKWASWLAVTGLLVAVYIRGRREKAVSFSLYELWLFIICNMMAIIAALIPILYLIGRPEKF